MFGLSLYTTERDLREVFSKYGPLSDVNIVYDQQSRRSRGFAFVYFENSADSKEVKTLRPIYTLLENSFLHVYDLFGIVTKPFKYIIFMCFKYQTLLVFFIFYNNAALL